jgi:GDSL-like Lipase/Acylhydrolase family
MPITRRQMMMTTVGATAMAAMSMNASGSQERGHIVLLGDSIFDNKVYVGEDDPAVIDQLRRHLPDTWHATLLAVDGDVTSDVITQLKGLPDDATHLVISVGGNDGLQSRAVLSQTVADVADGLLAMAEVRERFKRDYLAMLATVLAVKKPTAVCTIYDPNFDNAVEQRICVQALAAFNDVITRAAVRHGLPVIDLRVLFDSPKDYANPIEPSAIGGDKLTRTITAVVTGHDFATKHCAIYSG